MSAPKGACQQRSVPVAGGQRAAAAGGRQRLGPALAPHLPIWLASRTKSTQAWRLEYVTPI